MALRLGTYRLGTPRKAGEGLRLGTVRHLPRGVKKADYARKGYLDVWLPAVAPSEELFRWWRHSDQGEAAWRQFVRRYEAEMKQTVPRQTIALLAKVAEQTPLAVGCFCDTEHCHRFRLERLIRAAAEKH